MATQSQKFLVYIGTLGNGAGDAIFVYLLDTSTGAMERLSTTRGLKHPSFQTIDPEWRHLYSVGQIDDASGMPAGAVHAFSIDRATGELTRLNHQPSGGAGPCHVSVDRTARYVLAANYGSGSVAMLPIQNDGSLGEATGFVQHQGSSVDPDRQEGPHAHSIAVDPGNRYAFAPDLGQDKVMAYQLDLDRGRLVPNEEPWVRTAPGAGPRHLAARAASPWRAR